MLKVWRHKSICTLKVYDENKWEGLRKFGTNMDVSNINCHNYCVCDESLTCGFSSDDCFISFCRT